MTVLSSKDAKGERLDAFLAKAVKHLTRSRLQQLIAQSAVRVDGRPAKPSLRLSGREAIEVFEPDPTPALPKPENLPLRIVFQDSDLVVVDKAPGMVVHEGAGNRSGTLVNALLHHIGDLKGIGGTLRPGIVHRLDKDTSGLLVVAKSDAALQALQRAFRERSVAKFYLALVKGNPLARGEWGGPIARHPVHRTRFTSRLQVGRPARTQYEVVARFGKAAKLRVQLHTGRTHQIRVHCADAGFPILGDTLYGGRGSPFPQVIARQALHASRLEFLHPMTHVPMAFEAPLPADFHAAEALLTSMDGKKDEKTNK